MKRHTAIRLALFLILITGFFTGWPQIFGFPSNIQEAAAAFPTVASTQTSFDDDNGNSAFIVQLPSGIQAGDLIIAFAAHDKNNTATWPSPWVEWKQHPTPKPGKKIRCW
jgi:hypothetical protein